VDGPGGGDEARALRARADALRDDADWAAAAQGYAAYLAAVPDDWPIWVQHGHCVKEAGDAAGALSSYRRAEAGMPEDADLQLQIGHALLRAGNPAAARAAYGRAVILDPAGEHAWGEVLRLLSRPAGPVAVPAPGLTLLGDLRVVLDLSDLFSWFGAARAPSGIQRVQVEVTRAALARGAAGAEIRLAVFRPASGTWRELPPEAFHRMAGLSRIGADPAEPVWTTTRAQVEALVEAAPDLAFAEGAWLVNPGSSWWLPGYHAAVRAARAARGLRYAAVIHDTGPVTVPEHSEPAVTARFARWFAVLGNTADLLLAVSEATRADILRLAAEALPGLPFAPVATLRLDAAPAPAPRPARPHPRAAELAGEPYILFVATIESRKDHVFVLNAWLALLRRHGAAVPLLVLVGRPGFEAEAALALLHRAPALEGRVAWLDDVDDGTLAALYRGALFTIYHSRHEGWGLPVTEALAAGKAVVAPALPALAEAAAGLALEFPPGSEPAFLGLVERLLFEPGFREAAEARIAAGLRLRSWGAVAAELLDHLAEAPPAPPPLPEAPPLGLVHHLGNIDAGRPLPAMLWAEALRAGTGWHPAEAWGSATRPGRATLRLPLPAGVQGPLRLHLALRGAAEERAVALRVGRGMRQAVVVPAGARQAVVVPAGARPVVVLELPAPGDAAEIVIETPEAGDGTGIGIVAVMACAPDDVAARLGFLERLSFIWPEVA
jgi:glycosyltransferase involved in cell wall biosynthesis